MIIEDRKENVEQHRDLVEYAAQFVLGDSIQKLRKSREAEERKSRHFEEIELAKELGLEAPEMADEPVSGLTTDFDGVNGMAMGQDPFAVLKQLGHKHQQIVSEDLLNFDLGLDSRIDEIVVIRPDPNQDKPTIKQR